MLLSPKRLPTVLITIAAGLMLVACFEAPAPNQVGLTRTSPPPPADGEATVITPAADLDNPTATSPALPQPTITLAANPTASPTPCTYDYFFSPSPDACPENLPVVSGAAEQPFEGGTMVWLEVTDSIIVLYDDQSWQRFEDTWSEGQPENDPAIVPPDGRFQPIRGFGKLWREQPEVRERLGWALGVELGFEATLQNRQTEPAVPGTSFLQMYNGQVAALVHRASEGGDWVIAASQ